MTFAELVAATALPSEQKQMLYDAANLAQCSTFAVAAGAVFQSRTGTVGGGCNLGDGALLSSCAVLEALADARVELEPTLAGTLAIAVLRALPAAREIGCHLCKPLLERCTHLEVVRLSADGRLITGTAAALLAREPRNS